MGYYESGLIKIDNNKIKYNSNGELTANVSEIDDTSSSSTSTYSSNKINSLIETLEDSIESNTYVLPAATTDDLGGIKIDNTSITIDENGYAHAQVTMGNIPTQITDIQDGQILKYSSDGGIWENADEYTLPIATANNLGGVKVGEGLSINPTTGVLSANAQTPPTASTTTSGVVKVDGTTITINDGVISSPSEIDDASSSSSKTWSAEKISQAISSASEGGEGTVTSVSAGVGLTTSDGNPITSSGTVKAKLKSETASELSSTAMGSTTDRQYAVGVDADGYLSVNVPWTDTQGEGSSYVLPPATSSDLGGIKVGDNLNMDSTIHQGTLTANQFKISKYLAEGVEATNGKINLFEIDKNHCKAIEQQGYAYVAAYGISITINSDYSITINGTSTRDQYTPLGYYFDIKNNDKCFYTDNLEGETSLDTFVFGMRFWDENLGDYNYIRPVRNLIESSSVYASEISNTTISEGYEISELYLSIKAGITVTDVTCYPMVLHKGYLGVTDYYPPRTFYTNRELYNKIVDFSNKMNFLMQDCVSNNVYYPLPIGYVDSNLTVESDPYTHTITLNGTIPSGSTFDSGEIDIGYIKMNHPFKHTLLILDGGYIPEYCSLVLSNSNHGSYTISYSDFNTYDAFDLMHEYDSQEDLDKIPYTYQNADIYVINRDWETEDIGVSLRINKTSTSSYKEYDNDFFRIDVMVYDEGFDPNGYLNYQNGYKINVNLQNEVSELTSALLNLQSRVTELENIINSNNSV